MNPIFLTFFQAFVVLFLTPGAIGFIEIVKARFEGRRGPKLITKYAHYFKHLKKENVLSVHASWISRVAPFIVLGSSVFLLVSLPLLQVGGIFGPFSHFLVFLGVLTSSSFFFALAGLDAGSVSGGMGASRLMTMTALLQPTLMVILVTLAIASEETVIDRMIGSGVSVLSHPFLFLSFLAFILVTLAETSRYPVDDPRSVFENTLIHRAIFLEYSGPYLFMFELAFALKSVILALLIANILVPTPLLAISSQSSALLVVIAATLVKLFVAGFFVAGIESVLAKMRFYRLQEYLSGAFFLASAGLAIALATLSL